MHEVDMQVHQCIYNHFKINQNVENLSCLNFEVQTSFLAKHQLVQWTLHAWFEKQTSKHF